MQECRNAGNANNANNACNANNENNASNADSVRSAKKKGGGLLFIHHNLFYPVSAVVILDKGGDGKQRLSEIKTIIG
ncbi:MAG: hypothetical protein WCK34_07480 [Bacteroidota bacterium]